MVGDIGRAVMFDAKMGCDKIPRGSKRTIYTKTSQNDRLPETKEWFWAH